MEQNETLLRHCYYLEYSLNSFTWLRFWGNLKYDTLPSAFQAWKSQTLQRCMVLQGSQYSQMQIFQKHILPMTQKITLVDLSIILTFFFVVLLAFLHLPATLHLLTSLSHFPFLTHLSLGDISNSLLQQELIFRNELHWPLQSMDLFLNYFFLNAVRQSSRKFTFLRYISKVFQGKHNPLLPALQAHKLVLPMPSAKCYLYGPGE